MVNGLFADLRNWFADYYQGSDLVIRVILVIAISTLTLGLASRPTSALQVREDVSPLASIHMIDAETGWAMTAYCGPCPPHVVSGLLLRTTSGGTAWADARPVDSSGQRIDVGFLYANSDVAWVQKKSLTDTTGIFRTTDGGRTWKGITIPAPPGMTITPVSSISFINAREGWLIVSVGHYTLSEAVAVYRSTDGGETWTEVASTDLGGGGLGLTGSKTSITSSIPREG